MTTDVATAGFRENSDIPTRMDIFCDLNGSLGFAIGSSGFVVAMYYDDWLPYFRYGSLVWIWGCVFYSVPLFLKFKTGERSQTRPSQNTTGCCRSFPWDIGDLGVFLCCLFYTIGCVFGGFFDLATVDRFVPLINHVFLYGSLSLALEPAYQAILFVARGGSFSSRVRKTKLFGSPSHRDAVDADSSTGSSDNNEDVEKQARVARQAIDDDTPTNSVPLGFNWDRCFELGAMVFFCAAGWFGGFPPHPAWALPGQYFWEVGSLFGVARSMVMIHRRREGLKQLRADNSKTGSTLRK